MKYVFYCFPAPCNRDAGVRRTGRISPFNVLIIMTDQQRFDALSAAGNTILKTPNLDRIANEGVMFENAYTPVPVCAPARTSILTGQSIDNTGIDRNQPVYDQMTFKGGASFDMVLSEAGYKTGYYGKWHSPQQLASRYDNLDDYHVTATSGNAGMGISQVEHYRNHLDRPASLRSSRRIMTSCQLDN